MNFMDYYSSHTHTNPVTGCVIWDAEVSKSEPVVAGIKVRKVVYESVHGLQPSRSKFLTSCENPRCVKDEHITVEAPTPTQHDYPQDKVDAAWELYHDQGMRQNVIAEKLGINESTVSKYLKVAKAQHSEANGDEDR